MKHSVLFTGKNGEKVDAFFFLELFQEDFKDCLNRIDDLVTGKLYEHISVEDYELYNADLRRLKRLLLWED